MNSQQLTSGATVLLLRHALQQRKNEALGKDSARFRYSVFAPVKAKKRLRNPHAEIHCPSCLTRIPVSMYAARQGREGQSVAPGVWACAADDRMWLGVLAPGDCSLCDAATAGNARGSCGDSAGRGEPFAARKMRWWPKKRRLPPDGRGGFPRALPAVEACEE